MFRHSKKNGKADALIYRSGDFPEEGKEYTRLVYALISLSKFSKVFLSTVSIGFNNKI